MNDFPGPEEADRVGYLRIFYQAQDVVIGGAGFLLRSQILKEIGQRVAFALKFAGVKGDASGSLGPDSRGMIHVVVGKAGALDFLHGQVAGELMDDGGYHFQVSQLLGTYRSNGNVPYPEKR